MNINCHGEEVKLITYPFNGSLKTKCLIRGKNLLLTPEEKVRQAFLQRFIDLGLMKDYLFKVEHKSFDIAIYQKSNIKDFNPYNPPLLIVEVKKNENTNVLNSLNQIKKYLNTANTKLGLLGNCKELYIINSKKGNDEKFEFKDITETLDTEVKNRTIEQDIEMFKLAQNGDFRAFEWLTNKYDLESIFKFSVNQHSQTIIHEGFLFEEKGNNIMFNNKGVSVRKNGRRPRFNKNSFIQLLSIKNK